MPIQIVPPGQHLSEMTPLPVAASRLALKDLDILRHLGISTIGQLLSLPREDLPSRFSSEAVLRVQQLLDVVDEPIEPIPEANPVAAHWSSEEPATSLNDLQQVLRHLAEQIADQLVRRRMACSSVACQFQCADGSTVPMTASVVKPTQSSELLQEVLCLRIETEMTLAAMEASACGIPASPESHGTDKHGTDKHGTDKRGKLSSLASQPVRVVSMLASVVPIPLARQRDLFSSTEHIVPQEELATLITRLSNRLGSRSILTVKMQPDARPEFSTLAEPVLPLDGSATSQVKLDSHLQNLTDPGSTAGIEPSHVLPRPLRLLATPQQIPATDPGMRVPSQLKLMVAGKMLHLASFSNPERIQTAWWTDNPCHRDYHQVTTTTGVRLWLFRDLHTNLWFLHGIFD